MLGTSTRSAKGRDEGWKKKNLTSLDVNESPEDSSTHRSLDTSEEKKKKKKKLMLLDAKL